MYKITIDLSCLNVSYVMAKYSKLKVTYVFLHTSVVQVYNLQAS
jgi:hypothetical protein